MKDQGKFEKLSLARRQRDVFTEALTIRLLSKQIRQLKELSCATERTVSDLVRAGVELALAAGRRVGPWQREKAVKAAKSDGTTDDEAPTVVLSTSDNIRYVQFKPVRRRGGI